MLLEIKYLRIRIIDSSNFIQGPLSSFPKTFGLKELKKGYLFHFFNDFSTVFPIYFSN